MSWAWASGTKAVLAVNRPLLAVASIVPSLSPAGSTMVRPCQVWAVSMLGAGMELLSSPAMDGRLGGRDASARCPVGRPAVWTAWRSRRSRLVRLAGNSRVPVSAYAAARRRRRRPASARTAGPAASARTHAARPWWWPAPNSIALHGLDPAALDGDHGRADHDGQDGVPRAGHDPGGDLQLVQGGEGPEDQHRDASPLGPGLASLGDELP